MKHLISLGLFLTIDNNLVGRIVSAAASSINNATTTTVTTLLKSEVATNIPTLIPRVIIMEDRNNNFGVESSHTNSSLSNHPNVTPEDIQRTQMIAVVGFSAVVLMAIFAWLFSRHYCCFFEKALSRPGRHAAPQFNFLGAPARAIRRLSTSTVQPPKREDPPPSYDELFPTSATSIPAPAYTAIDISNITTQSQTTTSVNEETKDPEVVPSSQGA